MKKTKKKEDIGHTIIEVGRRLEGYKDMLQVGILNKR
jgi:hypothetical protein